jgi:DNA-binding FadR family transcriptional regulator
MLHHTVIQRWGADIVSGALPAGHRIGTDDAALLLGVSRTVVREAVRVLESMGLLTVRQRLGITVAPAERWNTLDPNVSRWRLAGPDAAQHLRDLTELRAVNEPLAARRAASCASSEQIVALTTAVIGMASAARSGDETGYVLHDANFHRLLLVSSGNPLLVDLGGLVGEAVVSPAARRLNTLCTPTEMIALHANAVAAIRSGDSLAAEYAARAILTAHPPLPDSGHQLPEQARPTLLVTA